MQKLTAKKVREIFHYDPETGFLTWREDRTANKLKGRRAGSGCASTQYRSLTIEGKTWTEHRIIWLYMAGAFPTKNIDHIDGNGSNNKWSNLREANHAENGINRRRASNNTSGYTGVQWSKIMEKWTAVIHTRNNGVPRCCYLGSFINKEDAARAYRNKAIELFGRYAENVHSSI